MKRSNLLKVLSVVMVVAMLMLSTTSAFAAVTAVQSSTDTTVNISGVIAGAEPYTSNVTITVLKPGATEADIKAMESGDNIAWTSDKFVAATSTMVKAGGAFECTIKLKDADDMPFGMYTVIVSPTKDGVALIDRSTTFYFSTSAEKLVRLKALISETNITSFMTKISDSADKLGIDINEWNSIAGVSGVQEKAAAAIIKDLESTRTIVDKITIDFLPELLKIISDEVYAQSVATGVIDNIADLADRVDIGAYQNMLSEDKINPDAAAGIESKVVGSNALSLEDLATRYKQEVLFAGVMAPKNDSGNVSREFLDTFAVDAGLTNASTYALLTDTTRKSIADTCRKSGATTFADLNTIFGNAVAALTPVTTPNPGSGSGSGVGGGSTTILTTPTPTPIVPTPTPADKIYNDIDNVEWAWEAIAELSSRNIFAGYGDGSFGPDNAILREEFIKIAVVGLLGVGAVDSAAAPSFTDAQSGWFAPYVAAAESNKITEGIGDGLFGTGALITRQDMALMLYRMLRDAGISTSTTPYAFTDSDKIADYAADAVYALKNMGIINGDPDGSFRPEGSTTRAEAAVLLYKTLDKLGKLVR